MPYRVAYRHPDIYDGPSKAVCYLPGEDWTETQAHNIAVMSTWIMKNLYWIEEVMP